MYDYDYDEDNFCDCGECRLCRAHSVSDYDSDNVCPYCNGNGCTKCEE